ncbi:MAG: hypothetical protein AB9866_21600 [Syntrophobacteraceae bacterium]
MTMNVNLSQFALRNSLFHREGRKMRGNVRKVLFSCFFFAILSMLLVFATPAMAKVTYTYVGNPFNIGEWSGNNITVQLILDDTVTSSFTGIITWQDMSHVISLTMSNGVYTRTFVPGDSGASDANLMSFGVAFVNGNIIAWEISIYGFDYTYPEGCWNYVYFWTQAPIPGQTLDFINTPYCNPPRTSPVRGEITENAGTWTQPPRSLDAIFLLL